MESAYLVGLIILGTYTGWLLVSNYNKKKAIKELQEGNNSLQTRIAVEEEKTSKIPHLEQQLTAKETELASTKEAKASIEATLSEKSNQLSSMQQELHKKELELEEQQKVNMDVSNQNATLKETLEQERKQSEEKHKLLLEAKESMTNEFKVLAENTIKTHGENFSKQNKEQIDTLLSPLKEKITEFNKTVQTSANESNKERAVLAEQIKVLSETSAKMSSETTNLTRALKADKQKQGAWGEMVLSSILEQSGLREGHEYTSQDSHPKEGGGRVRTDIIVNIPGEQKIVVDSKVSLIAFEKYVNASNNEEQEQHIAEHLLSIKGHISTLSGKEYQLAAGSHLDYVVMFVPIEGALAAALEKDPSITTYAAEKNVAIATPTTLMMALRTVANVWQVEKRNQNAEQIAQRAGKIYDKLAGFMDDMKGIGTRLEQASGSFSQAMGKLSTGRGNLIRQVEQLKDLGAKTSKSLPQSSDTALEDLTASNDESVTDKQMEAEA